MAVLENTQARLLWGPKVQGHKVDDLKWIPGKNKLDPLYWKAAKLHHTIKRWLKLGWIKVDLTAEAPDPSKPPSAEELAGYSADELRVALDDSSVPVQWHPLFEARLAELEQEARKGRLPPMIVNETRKSLSGLNLEEALLLIAAETDVDTLEAWATADERKGIDEAVDARLTELALDEDTG